MIYVIKPDNSVDTHPTANEWFVVNGALCVAIHGRVRATELYMYAPGQWTYAGADDYRPEIARSGRPSIDDVLKNLKL